MRAWERAEAPASLILLKLDFKEIREEFFVRALEREKAPSALMLLKLKSK